jgi:Tol biopolymer transport system component
MSRTSQEAVVSPRVRPAGSAWILVLVVLAASCTQASTNRSASSTAAPSPRASPVDSRVPVVLGTPIDTSTLRGKIVLSTEDDVYTANADGTGLLHLTSRRGAEFDPSWSPDGSRIVYRDSRRGINHDDEIYVMNADGTERRDITNDPANDWGPDWSPDGRTIVFNSTRPDSTMSGYVVRPDGSKLRRIPTDMWVEYPAWSPDGTRIAFMGGPNGPAEYDIWVMNADGSNPVQLTDSPGPDGWPAWSPDGSRIAFASVRDDCAYSDAPDCRTTGDIGPHHDIWVVNADGTKLTRVTPEFGQFVTWSPDARYLLVSGYDLYVIRPDGTGRTSLDIQGLPRGGLFPDWIRPAPE